MIYDAASGMYLSFVENVGFDDCMNTKRNFGGMLKHKYIVCSRMADHQRSRWI